MIAVTIYILIFLGLGMATLRQPGAAFAAVLCMFGIEQWAQGSNPFFLQHQSFTNLMVGALVLLGVAVQLFKGRLFAGANNKVAFWVVALLFYSFMSVFWSPRVDLSLDKFTEQAPYLITEAVLAPLLLCRLEDVRAAVRTLVILGAPLIFLMLYTVKWEYRFIIFSGSLFVDPEATLYGNPLTTAQLGGIAGLAMLLVRFEKPMPGWGFLKWLAIGLCLILVVRSGSRGQLIGAILTMAAGWPLAYRVRNLSGLLLWGLGLAVILGFTYEAFQQFWSGGAGTYENERWKGDAMEEAVTGRFKSAFILLGHWLADPFAIFMGLGNSASYDPRILGIYPHFVPLEVLAEEGIAGLGMYLWILYLTLAAARRAYKAVGGDDAARSLLAALIAMTAYNFILSCKQGSMLDNVMFFTFAILLDRFEGMVAGKTGGAKQAAKRPRPTLSIDPIPGKTSPHNQSA